MSSREEQRAQRRRVAAKFKDIFDRAARLDAFRLWNAVYQAEKQEEEERHRRERAEAARREAELERIRREDAAYVRVRDAYVSIQDRQNLRTQFFTWKANVAADIAERELKEAKKAGERAAERQKMQIESLLYARSQAVARRYARLRLIDDADFCFDLWRSAVPVMGPYALKEFNEHNRQEAKILEKHTRFLTDQAISMVLKTGRIYDNFNLKTIMTEWYLTYKAIEQSRKRQELQSDMHQQLTRTTVETDDRSFRMGATVSRILYDNISTRLMMRDFYGWSRYASGEVAMRREQRRQDQLATLERNAELDKSAAKQGAAMLAANSLQRRTNQLWLRRCLGSWRLNSKVRTVQQVNDDAWDRNTAIMEKIRYRFERATWAMSQYCGRQAMLVTAQRCFSALRFSADKQTMQDASYARLMEAEKNFEDDAGRIVTIFSRKADAYNVQLMFKREEWTRAALVRLFLSVWFLAREISRVTDMEYNTRIGHEDALAELSKVHFEIERKLFNQNAERYIRGQDLRVEQKIFTAWCNVKPLKRKTQMLEFLGVKNTTWKNLPYDPELAHFRIETMAYKFGDISVRRKKRELAFRLFITWRHEADLERLEKQAQEQKKKQHEAYHTMRDHMRMKVEETREKYQLEFEVLRDEAIVQTIFRSWLLDVNLIKERKLKTAELKQRRADYDEELRVISIEDGEERRKIGGTLANVVIQSRNFMLLFITWRGWRFIDRFNIIELLKVEIEELRGEHAKSLAAIKRGNAKFFVAFSNVGWRFKTRTIPRWQWFFAWRRAIMVSPTRHVELLDAFKKSVDARVHRILRFLLEDPERHTSGIFSTAFQKLMLVNIIGRWALYAAEMKADREVTRFERANEWRLEREKQNLAESNFNIVERVSFTTAKKLQDLHRHYLINAWFNWSIKAREYEEVRERALIKVRESQTVLQQSRRGRLSVAERLIQGFEFRQQLGVMRRNFGLWVYVSSGSASKDRIQKLVVKVRDLERSLKFEQDSFQRNLVAELEEQSDKLTLVIGNLVSKFSNIRGDELLMRWMLVTWATNSSMARERTRSEEERARLLADHRVEVAQFRQLQAADLHRITTRETALEGIASISEERQGFLLVQRSFSNWRLASSSSVNHRERTLHQQKMEENLKEETRAITNDAAKRKETAQRKAASNLGVMRLRVLFRSIFHRWNLMVATSGLKRKHASELESVQKQVETAAGAQTKAVKDLKKALKQSRTEQLAWMQAARRGVLCQKAFVAWCLQVRVMRLESYPEVLKKDFEARLQKESAARTRAEAEARTGGRNPLGIEPLRQDVATQTGDEGGVRRPEARSGPPSSKQPGAATPQRPLPAEQMLVALRRACRRNLVGALLALLTYEPQGTGWQKRRGRKEVPSWRIGLPQEPASPSSPRTSPKRPPASRDAPQATTCSTCGNTFQPDSLFCRKCGTPRGEALEATLLPRKTDQSLPEDVTKAADSLGRRALEKLAQVRKALAVPDESLLLPGLAGSSGGLGAGAGFPSTPLGSPAGTLLPREDTFDAIDTNRDGLISRTELSSFPGRQAARSGDIGPQGRGSGSGIREAVDPFWLPPGDPLQTSLERAAEGGAERHFIGTTLGDGGQSGNAAREADEYFIGTRDAASPFAASSTPDGFRLQVDPGVGSGTSPTRSGLAVDEPRLSSTAWELETQLETLQRHLYNMENPDNAEYLP